MATQKPRYRELGVLARVRVSGLQLLEGDAGCARMERGRAGQEF